VSTTGKILIIGGGPAGLGAAWRLHEAGCTDWELFEKEAHVGGLAASHVDERGFTWDFGGHVIFSHYEYFDGLLDRLLDGQWVGHERRAWVWMRERFIPYPLQYNIRHLPTPELWECVEGLLDAQSCSPAAPSWGKAAPEGGGATFADWIEGNFGNGLARVFLNPYNTKVWAIDLAEMSSSWVGERVAIVDLKRILRNIIEGRDDLGWGPNATFRFPLQGGTGRIWRTIAERLPAERLHVGAEVVAVDSQKRIVHLRDGRIAPYDWLITTMPLDHLVRRTTGWGPGANPPSAIRDSQSAQSLRYCSTHVIGVGLSGPVPQRLATKCWMYFPEPEVPFYRVTVFSNYSPCHVPHPGQQWSLLAEVSESAVKPVDQAGVVRCVVDGLQRARLLGPETVVESLWHRRVEHGYPIPFLERDAVLDQVEPLLYSRNILSRGRFGAWKYEVGNMDHSFMQGVEAVNHILFREPEVTLRSPAVINDRRTGMQTHGHRSISCR
jgi:protoporphyrinogen oxidase